MRRPNQELGGAVAEMTGGASGAAAPASEETEQLPAPAARAGRPVAAAPEPAPAAEHPSRWRRALPLGLAAAAVAAIVGLGLWNVVLTSDRQELQGDGRGAERGDGRPDDPGDLDDRPAGA